MGRQMSERAEFHVMGQPLDGTPLHYTASGLDYIYLTNGVTVENDPKYGRIVTIHNEDDLHRAIGLYIITRHRSLTGAEFRFLRKQMGFKQKELAGELGVNEQTVANYEKNKRIPKGSDLFMRQIFLLWITPEDECAGLMKRISEEISKRRARRLNADEDAPPADLQYSIAKQWQMRADMKIREVSYVC
jgi:transcriptional regulator with XRE-family HTH domain